MLQPCFSQSETLPWSVISMEFLLSLLRRHFLGKVGEASAKVSCFLRITILKLHHAFLSMLRGGGGVGTAIMEEALRTSACRLCCCVKVTVQNRTINSGNFLTHLCSLSFSFNFSSIPLITASELWRWQSISRSLCLAFFSVNVKECTVSKCMVVSSMQSVKLLKHLLWICLHLSKLLEGARNFSQLQGTRSLATFIEKQKKNKPKEIPRCLIPHHLLVSTWQLEFLVTALP